MSLSFLWLVFLTIFALLYYFRTPLRVKKVLWLDPNPMPMRDPPAVEDWPEVAQFLENGDQFESLGYQKEELVVVSEMMPNTIFFLQPFRNFEEVCIGLLSIALSKINDQWRVADKRIFFDTSFSNESTIATGFALLPDDLEPPDGNQQFLVTWTQDVAQLHSIHQRLISHLAGDQDKVDLVDRDFGGDMTLAVIKRYWKEWERYVSSGYGYLVKGQEIPAPSSKQTPLNPYAAPAVPHHGDRIRFTYKGAYLVVWNILFPIKQIRRWICGRKTKRVLRRC